MRLAIRRLLLTAFFLPAVVTCGHAVDVPDAPGAPAPATPRVFVSSRTAASLPRFMVATSHQPVPRHITLAEPAGRWHLARHAGEYGAAPVLAEAAALRDVHDTGRGGVIARFTQRVAGIEVHGGDVKVLMRRDLSLVAISGALEAPDVRGSFVLRAEDAVALALRDRHGLLAPAATDVVDEGPEDGGFERLGVRGGGLRFSEPARARRILHPADGALVPAWLVETFLAPAPGARQEAFAHAIAADDGRVLERSDLVQDAAFEYRVWAETSGVHRPFDGPTVDFTPHPTGVPDGSYPLPALQNLITMDGFNHNPLGGFDPWLPAGATETVGNNVDAYSDVNAPDGLSAGDMRARVTAPGSFDRPYDPTQGPLASGDQQMASVTQLFYVNNWLHDWFYDSGFNEIAGNAQKSNYGRGGAQNDPLKAEAQDSAPTMRNNANMLTPSDGRSPRMQMYVYDPLLVQSLGTTPSLPVPITQMRVAPYGPTDFEVSADLVYADPPDACAGVTNDVAGKIVLVDIGGGCVSAQKAARVEAAGGIGMIVADNVVAATPPTLSTSASFPGPYGATYSITLAGGDAIKASLALGKVSARLLRKTDTVERDGSLDNTIVAHEWGHYFHKRLTKCGTRQCNAMSEGWADFNALYLVLREGDDPARVYARPVYAGGYTGDGGYFGNRRYPYSTNLAKNPLTFRHIMNSSALPKTAPTKYTSNPNSEVHAAGEVWAVSMFEVYAAILGRTTTPARSFPAAQRTMADYLVAGMKMTPPEATYTEQKNAVLAAIAAADKGDLAAAGAAFAKRGLGACAVAPTNPASADFEGVTESSATKDVRIQDVTVDDSAYSCDEDGVLDGGEKGRLRVTLANLGPAPSGEVEIQIDAAATGLALPAGTRVKVANVPAYGSAVGVLPVELGPATEIRSLRFDVTAPGAPSCLALVKTSRTVRVNTDVQAFGSTADDVESDQTGWTAGGGWGRRADSATAHHWHATALARTMDATLTSPPVEVGTTKPLRITFKQRYDFQAKDGVHADGGVLEISDDGGATWKDASYLGPVGYPGEIASGTGNPLAGRPAWTGKSKGAPAWDTADTSLGATLAGKTVRLRFRVATDKNGPGLPGGWDIDDISLDGVDGKPFTALVPNGPHPCPAVATPPADDPPPNGATVEPPPVAPPAPAESGCGVGHAAGRSPGPGPLGGVASLALGGLALARRRNARAGSRSR